MSIELAPLSRPLQVSRPLFGLVIVLALTNLGWRSPDLAATTLEREISQEISLPSEDLLEALEVPPSAWSVGIDGWRIVVDGVAIPVAIPVEVALPAVPSLELGRDLRLNRLALYADSIGRYADQEGLDWRLVAAVIYEESAFRPDALSPAGAFGLMQVKEDAAREVGVFPYADPDSNIRAGVRYLAAMRAAFPAATPRDQLAMMLAAYNMGPGHMRDARALARALGVPETTWDGAVASAVRLLGNPAVHSRLRHGYAQGNNVIRYVDRVLHRYAEYRLRFPSAAPPSGTMIAELASR